MESMEPGQDQENASAVKSISVFRRVLNAIRQRQRSTGVSFPDLKKYLRDSKKLDVAEHAAEIKLALKNGMDRGILTKESGLYKVKTAARRRRSRSKGRKRSKSRKRSKRRKSSKRKRSGGKRSRSRRRRKMAAGDEE